MDLALIFKTLRTIAHIAGPNGLRGLQKHLRIYDDTSTYGLDELRIALKNYGIQLPEEDFNDLTAAFRIKSTGVIHASALFAALRRAMSKQRYLLVQQAFEKLDQDFRGFISLTQMHNVYNPSRHPEAINGRKTAQDLANEFQDTFDDISNPSGIVTWMEFEAYYAGVSALIDHDDYFELMMANCWGLDDLHLEAIMRDPWLSSTYSDLRSTLPPGSIAKPSFHKPDAPKRIVGYTGHIAGAKDAFGATFSTTERAAMNYSKSSGLPSPPVGADLKTMQFPKSTSRLAMNAHSYKLE